MSIDIVLWLCGVCGRTEEKRYDASAYCHDCKRYTMIISNSSTARAVRINKQKKEKRNA